ncbi:DUF2306 domain-containing protein [Pseudoxanthomonas indica]|uniref:Predicted membrane protein n=1 Tax=Pseudoxanthomonas indica TaxID=428993 RepID=A0A1T5KGU2_9GAMM|nr:DUF2306 domain-containing protein [Pseudoxanthomonas indica]GGD49349.1 hypothetical protein GCM10007235_21560 [Pseudoxanthomonas indica]SKC62944.1 Predicted membrane protein [Pseudoxanthomonas indica]
MSEVKPPGELTLGPITTPAVALEDRLLHWLARAFAIAALVGLTLFGTYIVLRASGATVRNFGQWRALIAGLPLTTARDWIANLGIGMHFVMGAILVLAWPILLSSRIRARHRTVHRWTGRLYVSAALLAGIGGLSFILTHGAYNQASSIAFGAWGWVMMSCAAMAWLHARARRFDRHRAWAIRLFAMVLGSWLFDIEFRAWNDLTGGLGVGKDTASGLFDYALLYLFFVPNLLVAEFFIRNLHRRLALPGRWRWPVLAGLAMTCLIFVYAIIATTATLSGKYGKHLLPLVIG